METVFTLLAIVLVANLAVGMLRVLRGPAPADGLSGILLFSSTAVALLLVLGEIFHLPGIGDAALALVLLSAVIATVFVQAPRQDDQRVEGDP